MRLAIRTRLSLVNALALALSLVAFSSTIYFFYRQDLFSQLDVKLRNDLELADDHLREIIKQDDSKGAEFELSNVLDHESWLVEVWDKGGNRVFSSSADDSMPMGKFDKSCVEEKSPVSSYSSDHLPLRVFCQESSSFRGSYILRVARLTQNIGEDLDHFRYLLFLGTPIVILLSSLLG